MAKFSLSYVKKNPVMFGAIFVVFGLVFWLLMNRGASSGSTQYVSSGPSEALQAAQLQAGAAIQAKQIDAQVANTAGAIQLEALSQQLEGQAAIATMELQYRTLELGANERLSELQTTASLAALQSQLNAQAQMSADNNAFAIGYARVAAESAVTQLAIGAALQRDLSAQQLEAFKYGTDASIKQTVLSMIPSLKKKDRDNALTSIASGYAGVPNTYRAYETYKSGGLDLGFVASPLGAIM